MKMNREVRKILYVLATGLLVSCAGSPLGDQVGRSLEADPQLQEASESESEDNSSAETAPRVEEPANTTATSVSPDESITAANQTENSRDPRVPEAGQPDFMGPIWSDSDEMLENSAGTAHQTDASNTGSTREDLTGVPVDLQTYIQDLQKLDVLGLSSSTSQAAANTADESEPTNISPFSQTISRRDYARWLFDTYNAFHQDAPGDRLRAGNSSDEPAFQDISPSDPDFSAIQGLAEAGIIPSTFTGNSTTVNFRPDAPLVREEAVLWKVPLDTRAVLPTTTPEAVTELWGFQDATSIDPLALRAIATDFQLGDFSNFRRAFGYTTLFRPDKAVTRAEAAAILWRFGNATEGRNATEIKR